MIRMIARRAEKALQGGLRRYAERGDMMNEGVKRRVGG